MATKKYGVNELREMFLSFFESKGHLRLPSFSLIKTMESEIDALEAELAGKKRRKAFGVIPRDW